MQGGEGAAAPTECACSTGSGAILDGRAGARHRPLLASTVVAAKELCHYERGDGRGGRSGEIAASGAHRPVVHSRTHKLERHYSSLPGTLPLFPSFLSITFKRPRSAKDGRTKSRTAEAGGLVEGEGGDSFRLRTHWLREKDSNGKERDPDINVNINSGSDSDSGGRIIVNRDNVEAAKPPTPKMRRSGRAINARRGHYAFWLADRAPFLVGQITDVSSADEVEERKYRMRYGFTGGAPQQHAFLPPQPPRLWSLAPKGCSPRTMGLSKRAEAVVG